MRAVMEVLHNDASTWERDCWRFVDELVFGESVLFAEARSVFVEVVERLIAAVPVSPRP